jgi:hypothetical protein
MIVRTAQFNTILGKSSVIIIKMRANTRSPESMPRVNPHLKTQTTDTSFAQNNIKSDSPGTYLPHAQNWTRSELNTRTVYNRYIINEP